MIAQTLRGGGVERAMLRLATEWIAAGRRVTLIIGSAKGPLAAEVPDGLEMIELDAASRLGLLAAAPRTVRALRPDVIFCPGNHYTVIAAWTRLRLGSACPPIVAKVSNALTRADQPFLLARGYWRWLRAHPLFVDRLVTMTPAMADEAATVTGFARDRVSIIPNPPARLIPGAAIPDLPPGRFLLGVGRLVRQKRWDRLIAAMPALADRDIPLVILGEGDQRPVLEAQINALGLTHRVHLVGHAADPLPAISRATLVALVSDYEGVPGVLREALALGTPVVATDSSVAVREIVSDPDYGSVVARDDPVALMAALNHWLAPGRSRPAPVPPPGEHAARDYLAVFDSLMPA